jgi:putative membrane protein
VTGRDAVSLATAMAFLLSWILSAIGLLLVARIVPGFQVAGFGTALLAAAVLGLVNATLGLVLGILTLPLTVITFGLFHFVVMALCIWIATAVVPGFSVSGFFPAFFGAIVLALIGMAFRALLGR